MSVGHDEPAETAHGLTQRALLPSHAADAGQPKLIKAHMTQLLIARVGLNKPDAQAMVDGFFELITQALEKARPSDYRGSAAFSCAINVRDRVGI